MKVLVMNPENENINKFSTLDIDNMNFDDERGTRIYRVLYAEEKDKLIDCCTLDIRSDLKTCLLSFPVMEQNKRVRPFIEEAVAFANNLGSSEVMISINPEDKKTVKYLEKKNDFTPFPVESHDKSIIYIYEKVNELGSYGK